MSLDRRFLIWALGYLAVGMCVGVFMAASHNFAAKGAHSHALLVGFALSLGYGITHKLWLPDPRPAIGRIQFVLHQTGAIVMSIGLFVLYGNLLPAASIEPVLAAGSLAVLIGALLMLYMVLQASADK